MKHVPNNRQIVVGGSLDPDTQIWRAKVIANGGSVGNGSLGRVNKLVRSIKTSSLGPKINSNLLRMFLLANFDNNETASFTDLINPATSTLATKSGSFTSTTLGYQGNGSTGFIDTKFKPSTDGGALYTTSLRSIGIYDLTSNTTGAGNIALGAFDGTNFDQILTCYDLNSNHPTVFLGDTTGAAVVTDTTNSQGFHIATRTDSTHNTYNVYNASGTHTSGSTVANSTLALPAVNAYLCARNNSGSADAFWGGKLALAFIGGTLTSAQMNDMSTAVNAYMKSLGINVY